MRIPQSSESTNNRQAPGATATPNISAAGKSASRQEKTMSANKNNVIAFAISGKAQPAKDTGNTKAATVNPLLKALNDQQHERGDTPAQMNNALGVSAGYIQQLANGLRQVSAISDDFAAACAKYLGLSKVHVLSLAERIKPQDFFSSEDAYKLEVERAMKFIASDARWSLVVTQELRASSLETKYGVVRLYEAATGTVLMTSRREN
jgi:hypothetical protein